MTAQPLSIDSREPRSRDLIERIASALPEQVRADYYREMAHCRSLPESDEMLRILRAMQFLALLIEQAPGEVAGEREKLTKVLQESVETVSATHRSTMEYFRKIEERIVRMPLDVSEGLQPRMIANLISNDLQRHLADVPQTVETLTGISYRINETSMEFHKTAAQLTSSYSGVAEAARVAIDQLQTSIGQAAVAARAATRDLGQQYNKFHNWTMAALCVAALCIGVGVGVVLDEWIRPVPPAAAPVQQVVAAPAVASGTPDAKAAAPAPRKRAAAASR